MTYTKDELIEDAVGICGDYLIPDGLTAEDSMERMVELFDCQKYREAMADSAQNNLLAAAPHLLTAVKHAMRFLKSLPKGWLGKTSGDIYELNQFYLIAPGAIRKAEGK